MMDKRAERRQMKVTVCQLSAELDELNTQWTKLKNHTTHNMSNLVLLPEMPFYPWICSLKTVDGQLWEDATESHRHWNEKLSEFEANIVIGTRPIIDSDSNRRYNMGYVWSSKDGIQDIHKKVYLPDEEGFGEAKWYDR